MWESGGPEFTSRPQHLLATWLWMSKAQFSLLQSGEKNSMLSGWLGGPVRPLKHHSQPAARLQHMKTWGSSPGQGYSSSVGFYLIQHHLYLEPCTTGWGKLNPGQVSPRVAGNLGAGSVTCPCWYSRASPVLPGLCWGPSRGLLCHFLGTLGLSAPFMPFGLWVTARSPCASGACHKVRSTGSHFPLDPVTSLAAA